MNLQLALPVLSSLAGRDVSAEMSLFFRARAAIGTALDTQGQEFFVQNWRALPEFMETEAGQLAIIQFMEEAMKALKSKQESAEPEKASAS